MSTRPKITVQTLLDMKRRGEKIVVLTAYDFPTARLQDAAGVEVILTATVTPNAQEIRDKLDWDGATEDPADPLKAKVPKDNAAKNEVKIKIDGKPCKEARVWVVYSTGTSSLVRGIVSRQGTVATNDGTSGPGVIMDVVYQFKFDIQPPTIITDADRPDFSGAPAAVPGAANRLIGS